MKLIEAPEHRPWPKFTEDTLVAEGTPKPVFVMPVRVRRDDGEVAWHSVHIRIGGLKGQQGAVYNSHTPAVAKDKADRLRADADSAGATGVVTFRVELNKTSRETSLTPADARRVADAIYEARASLLSGPQPSNGIGATPPDPPSHLQPLADELLFGVDHLHRIVELLEDRRQVIFQGPPGTGKTYVARKLAEHLADSTDRVRLVQFHPSYAYEDFIEGIRPTLEGSQTAFRLVPGPLRQAAEAARNEPDADHYLVIDEINRGNLAKVFGELYFLLEYRDAEIQLPYSQERFSLPKNLYLIGTMNTADRSIALVDLALRRRFHFVDFYPDEPPVKGLLRHWLRDNAPDMQWVADVVDEANRRLGDRHAAVGPSYFMAQKGLDERKVHLIWNHTVRPYIGERLFGEADRLREFELEALRRGPDAGGAPDPADDDTDEQDGDDATD